MSGSMGCITRAHVRMLNQPGQEFESADLLGSRDLTENDV